MDVAADIVAAGAVRDRARGLAAAVLGRVPALAIAAAADTVLLARLAADPRVHPEATRAPVPAHEVDHAQASAAL